MIIKFSQSLISGINSLRYITVCYGIKPGRDLLLAIVFSGGAR
jgi:hypothetical protein